MTAEEVQALVDVLRANGVRRYRCGDVEIDLDPRIHGPSIVPKRRPVPHDAVLTDEVKP